jgi:hypothetical protein
MQSKSLVDTRSNRYHTAALQSEMIIPRSPSPGPEIVDLSQEDVKVLDVVKLDDEVSGSSFPSPSTFLTTNDRASGRRSVRG